MATTTVSLRVEARRIATNYAKLRKSFAKTKKFSGPKPRKLRIRV